VTAALLTSAIPSEKKGKSRLCIGIEVSPAGISWGRKRGGQPACRFKKRDLGHLERRNQVMKVAHLYRDRAGESRSLGKKKGGRLWISEKIERRPEIPKSFPGKGEKREKTFYLVDLKKGG